MPQITRSSTTYAGTRTSTPRIITSREVLKASPAKPSRGTQITSATSSDKLTLRWSTISGVTTYDVVRGELGALPVGPGGGDETCFGGVSGTDLAEPTIPEIGFGYFYLVRAAGSCGHGVWGDERHNMPGGSPVFVPRESTTCP